MLYFIYCYIFEELIKHNVYYFLIYLRVYNFKFSSYIFYVDNVLNRTK